LPADERARRAVRDLAAHAQAAAAGTTGGDGAAGAEHAAGPGHAAGGHAGPPVYVAGLPQLRGHLGQIADRFFGQPSRALWIAGITGTNGKTTCAYLLAQAFTLCGRTGAYMGTLGWGRPEQLTAATHTTADVVSVHRMLGELAADGARCVGMEVSSHALDQGRVDEVRFDAAAFTNLTQDHLDYHGSMQAYGEAKGRLFGLPLAARVINVDDGFGRQLAARPGEGVVVATSRGAAPPPGPGSYVWAARVEHRPAGLGIDVRTSWGEVRLEVPLIGDFNVDNVLTVLAVLLAAQVPLRAAAQALARCAAPPGRMEVLRGAGRTAIVDYAHTPDALAKALAAARAHCTGRLLLVFGCGGERDAGKRPLMGGIAARLADEVVLTDDNPRGEDPRRIVADILAGITGGAGPTEEPGAGAAGQARAGGVVVVEHDRARAIRAALARACDRDLVLIAGKGHEDYQIVGAERRAFSDRQVVRAFMEGAA
ncbi:MAG TPA: UDP-N-acetylmuramoyl-L-alanyl-D-glutamate--2,6-diaminopimelate ligase, partial [Steroidobacteraceae bacterium]|nr:UDP-N-acetylmuramoyl-L-alanyl-D-glutamate--2,6-diaminopimelate ligase [Steroidobacteraceae bacterium]